MAKPRKRRKPASEAVKAAADAAERRAKGLPLDTPRKPIDPPTPKEAKSAKPATPTVYPIVSPGRPTKYKKEFVKVAKKMCALGATDADLAAALDVTTQTIWAWSCRHEAFSDALRVGKNAYDDRVVRALAQRAVGYSYNAVKIHQYEGAPVITGYVEHIPPDVNAAKLWLTNRRPEEWRESSETVHKHDATANFLKLVQHISNLRAAASPKLIEGKAA